MLSDKKGIVVFNVHVGSCMMGKVELKREKYSDRQTSKKEQVIPFCLISLL